MILIKAIYSQRNFVLAIFIIVFPFSLLALVAGSEKMAETFCFIISNVLRCQRAIQTFRSEEKKLRHIFKFLQFLVVLPFFLLRKQKAPKVPQIIIIFFHSAKGAFYVPLNQESYYLDLQAEKTTVNNQINNF